ncbi:MAG: transglutaminase domain-containing protein [Sulfuricurvum sp.]|nr:transglutaminase domain-containing protein [Sulfuricurvum sp.]
MDIWIKIAIVLLFCLLVYKEILKSAALNSSPLSSPAVKNKAGIMSLLMVGLSVGVFVYVGLSITNIETRDLRPYRPANAPQFVSIFDQGVIELNGQYIKTNLAKPGDLKDLATALTQQCHGNDACEIEKMFDYVTHIPYRTDHTSRSPKEVLQTNWGDCDDKSNLFASLLNERSLDYRFVYVPHHVFVVVHVEDEKAIPFLSARLTIDGKKYYYAETTASGSRIGEFNGQFPYAFEGIYDIKNDKAVDMKNVSFRMM